MNSTEIFYKISYLNMNNLLYKAKVNYSHVTIVQASSLKEKLEEMGIKIDKVNIELNNSINIYAMFKLTMIKKEVRFFSKENTAAINNTINL